MIVKLLFSLSVFGLFALFPLISEAVYIDPVSQEPIETWGYGCVLTPDPSEKDANTVYTLNIAFTNEFNSMYYTYWGRPARCDELQYHAEGSTSKQRLGNWLREVELERYSSHYYDGTVSTYDHKVWRLVNGKRQRIHDWLTMVAWGYLPEDNKSIYWPLTGHFYNAYPEIDSLQYNQGPYFEQVDEMWRNHTEDIDVPQRLLDELQEFGLGYYGHFLYRNPCDIGTYARGWNCNVFDFSFAYQNDQVWSN